jgi:hypothetical protein
MERREERLQKVVDNGLLLQNVLMARWSFMQSRVMTDLQAKDAAGTQYNKGLSKT